MSREPMMLTEVGIEQKDTPHLDVSLKHEMLKELQPDVLAKIKKGFDLYKGSVTVSQFAAIMLDVLFSLPQWQKYRQQIITFIEIFLLIDINHLEKIRFDEFTNYLIEREEDGTYKDEFQFVPAERLNELQLHTERIFKLDGSKNVGLLTNGKKNVQILEKNNYKKVDHLTCGGPLINSIIYIAKYDVFCLASNDKHLSFYENFDHTLVRRFTVPENIYFLLTMSSQSPFYRLVCGSTNGWIYEFSLSKILLVLDKKNKEAIKEQEKKIRQYPLDKQYKYFMMNRLQQQQKEISCMSVMDPLELVIIGANSKVKLYQMRQNGLQIGKELDGHFKRVRSIAVSLQHKLIVSCSFDYDILVWNAYLEHPVARLEGHQAPVVSVQCPKKYQVVISMDAKSVMKLWSSDNFQLLQNIVIYENFPANTSINFVYKDETNLAMVWTKKIKFFEYGVSYNPKLTDDVDLTAIKYSPKNLELYIASRKSLKVWSVTSGAQTKHFKDIVESDIAILQLDDRERRCFVGTIEGEIVGLDVFSGLVISRYCRHDQQVSLLLYNNEHKLLISGGWDKRIKIHNDTHHLQRIQSRDNVMRIINNVSEKDLQGGSFSSIQLFIATHAKSTVCRVWDFEKGYLECQYIMPHVISLVFFADPLPLLVVVDVRGTIYLVSTKYYFRRPYQILSQWKNMYSIQTSSQITFLNSLYDHKQRKCQLVLGDEYGYIRLVDISAFIEENDIKPVTPDMIGNKNPYRIQDYNYLGTAQNASNTFDFTGQQTKNIVPPNNIKQVMQIRAHHQRVTYVAILHQSNGSLLLSAGSDNLVKLWNEKGEPRGALRQGIKDNKGWQYKLGSKWANKQLVEYNRIKDSLQDNFNDYLLKKRLGVIPFTEQISTEQFNNEEIFKDLKEIEGYLQKSSQKKTNRRHY